MTDESKPKLSRGWRRVHELKRLDEAAKQEIISGLLSGLGRPATMADQIAVEQIAALAVHARRLERRNQFADAAKIRDQITRATRAFGVAKPQPAAAPKTMSPLEYARTKYSRPSVASDAASAPDASSKEKRLSEAAAGHSEAAQ